MKTPMSSTFARFLAFVAAVAADAAFVRAAVRAAALASGFAISALAASERAEAAPVSTSATLVEEVMTQSSDPRAYDWRRPRFGLDVGYGSLQEENAFKSRYVSAGAFASISRGWIARAGARMVTVEETGASRSLARTPYSQAGQPSRYEISLGAGYALLEGRSATPFSPSVTDLGHALYAIGGVHYNVFTSKDPEPVPAMRAVRSDLCAEAGVRFEAHLPSSLGAAIEWAYVVPAMGGDGDLPGWQRVGGSLLWSFGR